MRAVQVPAEERNNCGEADVLRGKDVQLLGAPDGSRLHDGVGVILDDGTAGEARAAGGTHPSRGVLQLWPEGREEGTQALAKALVDLDEGRGCGHEEVEHEGECGLHVVPEHGTAAVCDEG